MTLISPELKRVKVVNRKLFAAITGLSEDSIKALATGRRTCIKGWFSTHKSKRNRVKRIMADYTLVNVETKEVIYTWNNIKQFSKAAGLDYRMFHRLFKGEIQRYSNWVRKDTYNLVYNESLRKIY